MVSQGAQTNGGLNGRKLMKSLSEVGGARMAGVGAESTSPIDETKTFDHEMLHRTQSEEPPRSPFEITPTSSKTISFHQHQHQHQHQPDSYSRTSSRLSQVETSRSEPFSSENILTHSRNSSYQSQDSAGSFRSTEMSGSRSQDSGGSFNFSQEHIINSRRSSHHVVTIDPYVRREMEPIHRHEGENGYVYESHSLPRRACIHHKKEEFHTHSLPRREHYQYDACKQHSEILDINGLPLEGILRKERRESMSRDSSVDSNHTNERSSFRKSPAPHEKQHVPIRRASHALVTPETHVSYRRSSMQNQMTRSEDLCSTCSDDSKGEREILIDFKPRISPKPSPKTRKKRLQKTLSEGEILLERKRDNVILASASEEDLKTPDEPMKSRYIYRDAPIKDEGIFHKQTFLILPSENETNSNRYSRETFRKRSISLEEPFLDDDNCISVKSAPPSPYLEELSVQANSLFPSTDSLTNDLTRDHSDGIWNESQATVLQAENTLSHSETGPLLLTPSARRKNLLLQHQQRSSMDTDALDFEDHFIEPPLPSSNVQTISTQTTSSLTQTLSSTIVPTFAVTPSLSIEAEEREIAISSAANRRSRALSPSTRKELKKTSPTVTQHQQQLQQDIEPLVHRPSESPDPTIVITDQQINRSDSGKNNTDISEGSTNTDEYVTCTDNSKRGTQGTKTSAQSSSSTQVPVSAQSSQTVTQDGSSFESASSMYSLARGDAICEDVSQVEEIPLPAIPKPKKADPSPTHSASSSSSGSYSVNKSSQSVGAQTKSKSVHQKVCKTDKSDYASDDDKSEKRYSSSGYYESPHEEGETKPSRVRRTKEWSEEERRRKKGNFKLEFEKNGSKSLTSPTIIKSGIGFKQISPEDRTALNILDGTSPSKGRRFRPKTKRKNKTPLIKSPDQPPTTHVTAKVSPSKYPQKPCSPRKQVKKEPCSETRLKAISTESLRSVSPGSDSVFYSEADAISDHQVHCHHCGKEVEIVTATNGTQEVGVEDERPNNIVQPPAGFADSPDGVRAPQHTTRLYKKLDKRFRSEERHADRRHYRSRPDTRAKSEERGKDETPSNKLRPAGSSPCVMPDEPFSTRDQQADPEQGIYHGFYRLGIWICITDKDVWRRNDMIPSLEVRFADRTRDTHERRGSTDSEKDFRKKYQAITHRLVHRKSCVEMYRRQSSNSFNTDKTIIVRRESGEFGFRIHGSKPVVVSAIEPDTPAETSGLEVGDIVISVNGISVVDKSHSEVVKIAHAGSDTLELEVARTIGILSPNSITTTDPALYSGYLWRQTEQINENQPCKWVRRWFSLRPDHCLYFYKTDADLQPVGAILLTNHIVESCTIDNGKPFTFSIDSSDGQTNYLAADTDEEASRWIAVLSHASKQIDPWLELSTRNLRLPPNGIIKPDCFGYLMKLGNKWRAWSKRYCVLKDACLYFYHDGNSKSAFGMACLQGYRVQPTSTAGGRKFAFELTPPEQKLRHYHFSTESEMDKRRWVAALEYSIDRWMKAG